ncbi:MAG: FAD-dependent oxidoreductase [Alphaproteobacteria bacterium]
MLYDTMVQDGFTPEGPYDVCIAGGGVAGLVLATQLADRGKRILLLEAGELEYTDRSQSLYEGDSVGREYVPLDATRMRYLGGSSNHWQGWCRPLDPADFERRDHIPESGWPISYADMRRYQSTAAEILEVEDFPDPEQQGSGNQPIRDITFRHSTVRVGENGPFGEKYLDVLKTSNRIDVLLNANVVDAELDLETGRVSSFHYRGYGADAPVQKASATHFVVSMGGLENPRFLLNANKQFPNGLGNQHDHVGRYFMEHPHFDFGAYIVNPVTTKYGRTDNFVAATDAFVNDAGINKFNVRLVEIPELLPPRHLRDRIKTIVCSNETLWDIYTLFDNKVACARGKNAGYLRLASEQVPNRESRVRLSDKRDALGLRKIVLDWNLTDLDAQTIREAVLEMGRHFARNDFGRIRIDEWALAEEWRVPQISEGFRAIGHHHMGTTRMAGSAQDGVVDADCRVFGTENLYMAGSSVFRTVGHANPTFTIVQLTLRLADHLAAA